MSIVNKPANQVLHERSLDIAYKVAKEVLAKGTPETKLVSLKLTEEQLAQVLQMTALVSAEVTERMFLKYNIPGGHN
nr:hypothetical protein [Paenibacillus xylanexedens]